MTGTQQHFLDKTWAFFAPSLSLPHLHKIFQKSFVAIVIVEECTLWNVSTDF